MVMPAPSINVIPVQYGQAQEPAQPTPVTLEYYELVRDFFGNVTTATTERVSANKNRTTLWLMNISNENIFVNFGLPAVVNQGIRLNANGGSMEINKYNLFKGAINAIHGGSGNKVLLAIEMETRYPLE